MCKKKKSKSREKKEKGETVYIYIKKNIYKYIKHGDLHNYRFESTKLIDFVSIVMTYERELFSYNDKKRKPK